MKYRVQELEVPADEPFKNDALNRKPLVEFLSGLIGRLAGPFVLALDSPWGTGKTTLVKMLQADLGRQDFLCVYFNAWQVDYVNDPLVALVSAIDEIRLPNGAAQSQFRTHLQTARKITTAVAKRGVIAVAKAATLGGLDLEKDIEAVATEVAGGLAGDAVDAFQKEKKSLEKFRQEVAKAIELTLPLKNVSLAEWFNSDKENGNGKN
ncbi:KAP family P-loop NTPase fold protein, partial [Polaromonas sp. DSP2-3-2b2]